LANPWNPAVQELSGAVAMHIYAAAMVHAAFRIAQARIAKKARITPEEIHVTPRARMRPPTTG
jgi:hypothetical protein